MEQHIETCLDKVAQMRGWMLTRLVQPHPWKGLSTLPEKADGTFYAGTNVPLLWMQQDLLGSKSPKWGTSKAFRLQGKNLMGGSMPQTAIWFKFVDEPEDGVRSNGSSDDPFHLEPVARSRRKRILQPVALYNECQTEGYCHLGPPPCPEQDVRSLLAPFPGFCRQYMQRWNALAENARQPITPVEESFLIRFATDLAAVGSGYLHASDIAAPYSGSAVEALTSADASRLMKLAGIAQDMIARYQKTNLPKPRPVAVDDPFPAVKTNAPSPARVPIAETPIEIPMVTATSMIQSSVPAHACLDW
ncbi:ArdC-like ssDNA-binding domain-containing protein [Noviherbaspirillum galbum]|uniref:ArdC family protein n=1 Tax=Noviherbaspirillum galbum TaxID=2709383 RepID=A0A6B3SN04_9BURK|nr:ArdC-like ssDNA-binding domain-containing protein [Noviherbaspirillum galbum]NEX60126.1 ArdC family protein [Noviherbaspirillum galbum]